MDRINSTTFAPDRKRGQHLKFEDRCSIKVFRKLGYSLRRIAVALGCSPSTVMYELKRGTGQRTAQRGRPPEYSAKRGQENYERNRARCHKKHKLHNGNPFVQWMLRMMKEEKWSFDACVGFAIRNELFPRDQIPCTKTLYNELWAENLTLTPFDVPEALKRAKKRKHGRKRKKVLGTSIDKRPDIVSQRSECGHWEIDTVIGRKSGRESVVLTIVEKMTDYYIAIKIPSKEADSVMAALNVLREEYGEEHFAEVFKTITADNGNEFSRLAELDEWGVKVYFAHPYSSWERGQNERHNRLLRRYIPKGQSIENYSAEQISWFADEINALPRKHLGYAKPEDLFDGFLDQVYSVVNVHVA